MPEEIYTSGVYLEKNPTWHVEESPWKEKQIIRMLRRNHMMPKTICEVGCGAGEILKLLQEDVDRETVLWGYEISPQAFELAKGRENEKLHFKLADFTQEQGVHFDLVLIIDVIEHLEDYFSFLRAIKSRGEYKLLHIPLDLSVQTVLRGSPLQGMHDSYGHIHYFSKESALQMLKDVGYEPLDYCYTALYVELPTKRMGRKLLLVPRKLLFAIHHDVAARILGGFSLLVLAK